jgi:hypothetical protein
MKAAWSGESRDEGDQMNYDRETTASQVMAAIAALPRGRRRDWPRSPTG